MKKYMIYFACLLAILWGCNHNHKTDNHDGHNHEKETGAAHNHDHPHEEGHSHNHENGEDCDHSKVDENHDHNHVEGEECRHSHGHEAEEKSATEAAHSDEIVFTPEQAKAVGLEFVSVKPSAFHQVIKTSGQILSAQGDEVTISATASGIVSFNKSSLNEGATVRGGESLLSISSKNMVDGDPVLRTKSA